LFCNNNTHECIHPTRLPGPRGERIIQERDVAEAEDVGSNNLFRRRGGRNDEDYTLGVKEGRLRIGREGNARRARKRHARVCIRNNYPASCRPLLPRKSLTSCWRAEVRIFLSALWEQEKTGKGGKERRRKKFSPPRIAAGSVNRYRCKLCHYKGK